MASYDTNDNRRASTRNVGRPKPDYGGTRVRGKSATADGSFTALTGQSSTERKRPSLLHDEHPAAKRRKAIDSASSATDKASEERTPKTSGSGSWTRRKSAITNQASPKTPWTIPKRRNAATQVAAQPEAGLDSPLSGHSSRAGDLDDVASSGSLSDAPSSPPTPPHLRRELRNIEQRRALAASEPPRSSKKHAALVVWRSDVNPARAAAPRGEQRQREGLIVTLPIAFRSPQATDEAIKTVLEGLGDSAAVSDREVHEQENLDYDISTASSSNCIEILRHEPSEPPVAPTEASLPSSASPSSELSTSTPSAEPRIPARKTPSTTTQATQSSSSFLEPFDSVVESTTAAPKPTLVAISRKMTARRPLVAKPLPQGEPEVWADSRQALCETVPYFKMPQSGCHQNDRHVYAFLFDGVGHCREYMDSDMIIARAGGSMEADSTGNLVQKKDHLMSESQVQGVINDIEHKNPLVIICGDKNDGAVCKMPHRYNVLGWYKPMAVWAEKTTGKGKKKWTTIKYRFERLGSSQPAWHAPTENVLTDEERNEIGSLEARACDFCHSTYPRIYLIDWMCLDPECRAFWRLRDGSDAPGDRLDYNPAFLTSRTYWENEEEPYSVRPSIPDVGNSVGDNLTYINTRGICCRQCGRCSSRRLFKGWQCDNPSCDYHNFPKHISVKVPMLHNPWETMGEGPALARNKHDKSQGVKISVSHTLGFKIYTYTFEGVDGRFVHAVSNKKINRATGGPDAMFAAMQSQDDPAMDLHLERRRFAIERGAGGVKTDVDQNTPARKRTARQVLTPPPFHSTGGNRTTINHLLEQTQHDQDREVRRSLQEDDKIAAGSPELISSSSKAIDQNQLTQQPSPPQSHEGGGESPESSALYQEQQTQGNLAAPMASRSVLGEVSAPLQAVGGKTIGRKAGRSSATSKLELEDGDFMTAFSMNYGMPYKFVASGASLPFTNAPWPVNACRADLNWASQSFLDPKDHTDFNELLIFAYLEGQKIEYHDDGETGLGPRIATLSLGGKAKMHMRMKMKHYVGCSKQGVFTAEKPVPGSIDGPEMYQKRLAAWKELQHLKHTNKSQYERRRKEMPKELGLFEKRYKKAEDLVTVTLNHGDIVLMEGYEIQQYLEHKVVPEGCLRFALTCRTVLPEHLRAEELPWYEVGPDDEGMSSLRRLAAAAAAAQEAGDLRGEIACS